MGILNIFWKNDEDVNGYTKHQIKKISDRLFSYSDEISEYHYKFDYVNDVANYFDDYELKHSKAKQGEYRLLPDVFEKELMKKWHDIVPSLKNHYIQNKRNNKLNTILK